MGILNEIFLIKGHFPPPPPPARPRGVGEGKGGEIKNIVYLRKKEMERIFSKNDCDCKILKSIFSLH